MKNLLKEKLDNKEKTLGIFHELVSPTAVECLKYGGMDYVIIDTEHGPGDVESTLSAIRAAKAKEFTPLVRVKDTSRTSILKMLDIGAMGIIVPDVKSLNHAKEIISYAKYFPLGNRGLAPTAGSAFWFEDYGKNGLENYFQICNKNQLLILQCETKTCLDEIEKISSLEGLDGIFVGTYDLSISLGKPGAFEDEEMKSSIHRILKSCKLNNKYSFIYAGDKNRANKYFEEGFDSVTFGMDAIVLTEAIKSLIGEIKR